MPWTPQGGGGSPWGGGSGGPWGRGSGGGNGSGGPPGPDLEDIIRRGQEKLRRMMPGGGFSGGRGLGAIVLLVVAGWLATGIYQVRPDEQGVVMLFGKWVDTTEPGLHYHLPYPIQAVLLPRVTAVNQLQLGFRTGAFESGGSRDVPTESRMLTGDENLVEASFSVFWQIKDAGKFLFNVRDPENTVKVAAESAMREAIGRNTIQSALSEGRENIAAQAQASLQRILDSYDAGIYVKQVQLQKVDPPTEVIDAFNDVQRARADQERSRNEAQAYRNDIIPRARGDAARIVQDAEAYKEQVLDLAQGEAKRFTEVLAAYHQAEDVTARRLYLEAMQDILKGATKIIIDPAAKGTQGVVPYLPLPEPGKNAAATTGSGGGR